MKPPWASPPARALAGLAIAVTGASCALSFPDDYAVDDGAERSSASASGAGGAGSTSASGSSSSTFAADTCPQGMFATDVTPQGKLVCASIDAATVEAVNLHCAVYAGWRPPEASADTPTVFGRVTSSGCANGAGSTSCANRTLDGRPVNLLRLSTNSSISPGHKFYYGLKCEPGSATTAPGPCAAGTFLQGHDGVSGACVAVGGAITSYVNTQCHLYAGWNDDCYQDCTNAPERWGWIGAEQCNEGAGPNTCITAMFAGAPVGLLGLSTTNIFDYTDKLSTGLVCTTPPPVTSSATGACPEGELVVGIEGDGTLQCADPAQAIATAFASRCTLYGGWDQALGAGDQTPVNWGSFWAGDCTAHMGDVSCNPYRLNGVDVKLFGLNTEGGGGEFLTGVTCALPGAPVTP